MLWQTAIMYSGKHDFLDWIISATIHLENPANTENDIWQSWLIHLHNMSKSTKPEVHSSNLHKLVVTYWVLRENQIKSGKFKILSFIVSQVSIWTISRKKKLPMFPCPSSTHSSPETNESVSSTRTSYRSDRT